MAIILKRKMAEIIANSIVQNVTKAKAYFSDATETDILTASTSVEVDETNKCYYANITFYVTTDNAKTIVKIEFYDNANNLLFVDNGNLTISINQGTTNILERLKIGWIE